MRSPSAGYTAVVSLLLGLSAGPASAQGIWTEISTLGGAGTGFGVGLTACWSCSYGAGAVVIAAATLGGAFVGHRVGGSAEGAARRGERLTAAQLWGARVGTVTGFAVLGAGAAAVIINESEGNAEGEDERRLLTYSLVGAVLGVIVEVAQEAGLSSEAAAALQSVSLEPGENGATRIGLRWRF